MTTEITHITGSRCSGRTTALFDTAIKDRCNQLVYISPWRTPLNIPHQCRFVRHTYTGLLTNKWLQNFLFHCRDKESAEKTALLLDDLDSPLINRELSVIYHSLTTQRTDILFNRKGGLHYQLLTELEFLFAELRNWNGFTNYLAATGETDFLANLQQTSLHHTHVYYSTTANRASAGITRHPFGTTENGTKIRRLINELKSSEFPYPDSLRYENLCKPILHGNRADLICIDELAVPKF